MLHEKKWFELVSEPVKDGNGTYQFLHVAHRGVRVVVFDDRGRVLLVRQFRQPVRQEIWEIPAGGVELGEEPLAAAKRELAEEAGLAADDWRPLGTALSLPNVTNFEPISALLERQTRLPGHLVRQAWRPRV